MIRHAKDVEIKAGQWVLLASPLTNGLCGRPRKVTRVTPSTVVTEFYSHPNTKAEARHEKWKVKYVCDTEEEAQKLVAINDEHVSQVVRLKEESMRKLDGMVSA